MLTGKIQSATQAIDEVNKQLENIANIVPNATTKQEVDALLGQITQQLDQSIQNIGSKAQQQSSGILGTLFSQTTNVFDDDRDDEIPGNVPKPPTNVQGSVVPPPPPVNDGNIDLTANITVKDISGNDVTMQFGTVLQELRGKDYNLKAREPDNKYTNALTEIRKLIKLKQLTNISQVQSILEKNRIPFKNNKVMGGKTTRKIRKPRKNRKTRKIRKQKGGFTYKSTTKRQSIRTSKMRNSSRRTSK